MRNLTRGENMNIIQNVDSYIFFYSPLPWRFDEGYE